MRAADVRTRKNPQPAPGKQYRPLRQHVGRIGGQAVGDVIDEHQDFQSVYFGDIDHQSFINPLLGHLTRSRSGLRDCFASAASLRISEVPTPPVLMGWKNVHLSQLDVGGMALHSQSANVQASTCNYRVRSGSDRFSDILSVVLLAKRTPDLFNVTTHCCLDKAVYELGITSGCISRHRDDGEEAYG